MVGSGDRSERIRTYNFPQSRLTDHRINLTLHTLERVLEGRTRSGRGRAHHVPPGRGAQGYRLSRPMPAPTRPRVLPGRPSGRCDRLPGRAWCSEPASRRRGVAGPCDGRDREPSCTCATRLHRASAMPSGTPSNAAPGASPSRISPAFRSSGRWSSRSTAHVLIPRPETERVVELALELLGSYPAPRILDLGTGSGCIAVTLASQLPQARVWACDVSAEALAVARTNAVAHNVAGRMTFMQTDMRQAAPRRGRPLPLI